MATDLDISHHAVEKRLKMARTKLGATSSFEAARMLAEAEGCGQTVPQAERAAILVRQGIDPVQADDERRQQAIDLAFEELRLIFREALPSEALETVVAWCRRSAA